jgi:hypothetical protein
VEVRRCSCRTCNMYLSWLIMAGPRFLSLGTITNSFEFFSVYSVFLWDGVRLV